MQLVTQRELANFVYMWLALVLLLILLVKAFGVMGYSAMIDFEPVPVFLADRPFIAAIFTEGAPYFISMYRGEQE